MDKRILRIGIDVGGTFTHAVALEQPENRLIAHAVTPTTHTGAKSVSAGIITAFREVMKETQAKSEEVCFIAHSTTQATNALLEGDVAKVGIIGMGKGLESLKAKNDTRIKTLELSPGKMLYTSHVYLNSAEKAFNKDKIITAVNYLKDEGCTVIVASEAFGVDNTSNEKKVVSVAVDNNIPATASHEISQLYGLKIRTRTAVVNASILPKMTTTANITDKSIKKSGINVPLMIMRSDGGVMDLYQMRQRPILTLLSGPAAGIAAALMYVKVSDGIFLETGGTSTDISAIKDGKAMIKTANIGGHLTNLKTLDSRTVGIGGGSMVRMNKNKVLEAGPRSAHIAGFDYLAFCNPKEIANVHPEFLQPMPSDPQDYLVAVNEKGKIFAVTLTDAAIVCGVVKKGDYAYSNETAVRKAFEQLGRALGTRAEKLAEDILNKAAAKVVPVIKDLLEEYKLEPDRVSLIGGGGGCTALVPHVSRCLSIKYTIAEKAEVISAIGAAVAMLRDTVERTVIEPGENDIIAIRKEVIGRLERMGADTSTIEVQTEFDRIKSILRAIATGALHMNKHSAEVKNISVEERKALAVSSFKVPASDVCICAQTEGFTVFECSRQNKVLLGLFKSQTHDFRVLDMCGLIRLQINAGFILQCNVSHANKSVINFIEEKIKYTDAGIILPEVFLLYKSKIADFSTVLDTTQLKNLIKIELDGLDANEALVVLLRMRK